MALINGSDCVLQLYVHDDYQTFMCAKSFSLQTSTELIETTTKGDGQWKSFKPHSLSYTVSLTGIAQIDTDQTTIFDVLNAQLGFTEVPFRAIFTDKDGTDKIIEGVLIVTSTSFEATPNTFLDNSVEFQGTGSYEIKDTLEGCETYIDPGLFATFVRQFPLGSTGTDKVEVQINIIHGDWQKFNYSIDGSASISSFYSTFIISGVSLGTHTITLTPVCPNGIEGVPYSKTFIMS